MWTAYATNVHRLHSDADGNDVQCMDHSGNRSGRWMWIFLIRLDTTAIDICRGTLSLGGAVTTNLK